MVLVFPSTYLGLIGGYHGSPHQNGISSAVFGRILPRFGAVRAQNWSQVDKPCPGRCNFTVLRLSSTYRGIIGGYSGSQCQNGNFSAFLGPILPRFGAMRAQYWSQVNTPCPEWCNFTVLRLFSTYHGIIGGLNGSRPQNGIFRG